MTPEFWDHMYRVADMASRRGMSPLADDYLFVLPAWVRREAVTEYGDVPHRIIGWRVVFDDALPDDAIRLQVPA